jgi:hypothetical protein
MIIEYLKDTLFVSHGINFEKGLEVEVSDVLGAELIETFSEYFKNVTKVQKVATPSDASEADTTDTVKPKKAASAVKK